MKHLARKSLYYDVSFTWNMSSQLIKEYVPQPRYPMAEGVTGLGEVIGGKANEVIGRRIWPGSGLPWGQGGGDGSGGEVSGCWDMGGVFTKFIYICNWSNFRCGYTVSKHTSHGPTILPPPTLLITVVLYYVLTFPLIYIYNNLPSGEEYQIMLWCVFLPWIEAFFWNLVSGARNCVRQQPCLTNLSNQPVVLCQGRDKARVNDMMWTTWCGNQGSSSEMVLESMMFLQGVYKL